ncbi:MAG: hypothetical protein CR996_01130 [Draconibacterium sp.]|nr:MAG: hypothetical protein CR996_01130 [Draconibacterium sp.]PIF06571.1 MAG: hypothetical protein CSA36_01015 [Draconibacterium sp.]
MYGKIIKQSSSKELGTFLESILKKDVSIKNNKWREYQPLRKEFCNHQQVKSEKKENNFPDLHRAIMGFKGWLKGMHQHVKHLQAYIDEDCYRFNRNFIKEGIFDNLLIRMVNTPPVTYKQVIA